MRIAGTCAWHFGLLVLELHTLPPELAAVNLRLTPVVAYDGTNGFSDQYLVELPIFLSARGRRDCKPMTATTRSSLLRSWPP